MSLRKRSRQTVEQLNLPASYNAEIFCGRLAITRGRPIELMPIPLPTPTPPDLPNGLWCYGRRSDTDYILYDPRTSQYHRQHIIFHEAAHMVLGHEPRELDDDPATLLALLQDGEVGLLRERHSTKEERAAETMATYILLRGQRPHGDGGAGAYQKFSDAVGFHPWY